MTFEEWWQREYPYNQYERHFGGRAWQAAQAEQAAECERLRAQLKEIAQIGLAYFEKVEEEWGAYDDAEAQADEAKLRAALNLQSE